MAVFALLAVGSASSAQAQELIPQFEFSIDTRIANPSALLPPEDEEAGYYRPLNVVAVWVTDDVGNFVKTVYKTNSVRSDNLIGWAEAAPIGDIDGVSGATRLNHEAPVVATWDLTDQLGEPVLDGIYHVYMELADAELDTCLDCVTNLNYYTFEVDGLERTQNLLECEDPPCLFDNVTANYALIEPEPDPVDEPEDEPGDPGDDPAVQDDSRDPTVVGGCATSGGSAPAGSLLVALGLLWGMRRRRD